MTMGYFRYSYSMNTEHIFGSYRKQLHWDNISSSRTQNTYSTLATDTALQQQIHLDSPARYTRTGARIMVFGSVANYM
jgi:hypothetical protein